MDVNGLGSVLSTYSVARPQAAAGTFETGGSTGVRSISIDDHVEISSAGRLLDEVSQTSESRMERLAQIKGAIADGLYETPGKLQIAVERLWAEIGIDE
ncbi:MAG: flagellar biosynthesis anti-sigma factor FlgM [Planctomycetaceae bacterium]